MKTIWPIAVLLCAGCASSPLENGTLSFPPTPTARAQEIPTTFSARTQLIPTQPVVSTLTLASSQMVLVQSSPDLKRWSDLFVLGENQPTNVNYLDPQQFFRGVQMVRLFWTASDDANVVGYKVYQGTASREYGQVQDVGNAPVAIVKLLPGATNYFTVTAYDAAGTESNFSNEAIWVTQPATLTLK